MPDIAESEFDYIDAPVFDDFWPAIDESRFEFGGQVQVASTGDGAAPVVTLVSPLTGRLESFEAVVIDVTDNVGLGRTFLVARMPGSNLEELIYAGNRFTAPYAAQSSQVAIAGGFRFTVKRSAGWPSSPTIDAYAVDASGTTE